MNGFVYGPRRHNNREALSMGKGSSRSSPPTKVHIPHGWRCGAHVFFFPVEKDQVEQKRYDDLGSWALRVGTKSSTSNEVKGGNGTDDESRQQGLT